jgi:hypothetical protein
VHTLADHLEARPIERPHDLCEAIDNAPDYARARFHPPDRGQGHTRPVRERLLIDAEKRARRAQLGSS